MKSATQMMKAAASSLLLLPTALAAAGVEASSSWRLDGVNLLPFINGADSSRPHETFYWRFGRQRAVRHGDWKLVKWDEKPFQLYHLSEDLGETTMISRPSNRPRRRNCSLSWTNGSISYRHRSGFGPN
jgi:arylsulfatase A-like enzyme